MKSFAGRDDGTATILVAGLIAAFAGLAFVLAAVGGARIDAHQARLAADLAAVAGAFAQVYGEDGCAEAAGVAGLNEAHVVDCLPDSQDLVVTVEVGGARATARAGPI